MIAEIITIGTEVVMGSTSNTNALFLSQKLTDLGFEIHFQTSVDDNPNRLKSVINIALIRADLIITTGGLGPTKDDMTKEVISEALGLDISLDSDMENEIKSMFSNSIFTMTKNNQKQAFKPNGSKFIKNEIGTAPGIYLEKNHKQIIMLPGPPLEMELMFKNFVINLFKKDLNIVTKSINLVGIGESYLEEKLNKLQLNTKNVSVLTFAKNGIIEIKIIAKGKDEDDLKNEVSKVTLKIEDVFYHYIYGYDNISLEEVVVNLLKDKQLRLSLAESITGGLISSKITKIPGASKIFERGIVTYTDESKIDELGVKESTLKNYGAVSKETAREMAKGLFFKTKVDIALSITGFAGPGITTKDEPIGLVYIALICKNYEEVFEYNFNGNRDLIQKRSAVKALDHIRLLFK
nr:competence/damage-inducible protein A [Tissierella sp.]